MKNSMTVMNCASVLLLVSSYWTQTTVGFTYAPSAISHAIQTIVAESRLEARRKKQENDDPNGQPPQVDPAKRAALDGVLTQIERSYGRGSIVQLGSAAHMEVASISSGALTLDAALGGGGFPKGRVVEIYGPESSGKTTLALHAIAESQKQGGIAAFVDAEHALIFFLSFLLSVNSTIIFPPSSPYYLPSYNKKRLVWVSMWIPCWYHSLIAGKWRWTLWINWSDRLPSMSLLWIVLRHWFQGPNSKGI